jgi:hypothetical protein
MTRALAVLLPGMAFCLAFLPRAARAEERWALVIGANEGEAGEPPLVFAERDAGRVGQVLTRLGGVPPQNLVTLLGPDAALVRRAIESLGARMRLSSERPTLFVYYSGHSDSQSLHLSGSFLPFKDLRRLVEGLEAELSVFIVDACRSGGLIRAKGARPAEPFAIAVRDELRAEGVAILTSSSASEDAQESDRLEGGVFTHHLLTGLSGAADEGQDGRVTLGEAYRYAYAQTLAATSASPVIQHPSFSYAMEGQAELVVTRLEAAAGFARLQLPEAGQYLVFERFGGQELAAELTARAGTELLLRPGLYLLRRREAAAVREREVLLLAHVRTPVPTASLRLVPYRHAVRKGYGQARRSALSLGADLEGTGPLLGDTSVSLGGALGLQLDLPALALRARLRSLSAAGLGDLALTQHALGLDLAAYRLFDLGRHGLGFGLRAGLDWVAQRFETAGEAPARDQVVWRLAPLLRAELALGGRVALNLDAGAEVVLLERLTGRGSVGPSGTPSGVAALEARVVPVITLGFGVLLP